MNKYHLLASSLAVKSNSNVVLNPLVGTIIFCTPPFFFPLDIKPA